MNADVASKLTSEERIAARWERIKDRRQNQDAQYDGGDVASPGEINPNKSLSKAAVAASRARIGQLQIEARRKVSGVQLRSDMREFQRRKDYLATKEAIDLKLEKEAQESQAMMDQIDSKWNEIGTIKVPQEIADRILEQEDHCTSLLKNKAQVIAELENEMKLKSEEHTQLLKVQEAEVGELLQTMHQQFQIVQTGFETELESVEAAFLEERRLNLEANRKQIDELFEARRNMELQILDSKMKRDQKYQDELDELRGKDTEDYNKLKMNLENNIQLLEQQLEEMRSTYQLNTEKLNYNFQVLKEREKENMDTVDHQKRKLKRLSATLSALKQKYTEQDKRFKQENHEITEEYRRITRQYKELQKKFRHFERTDTKKYDEIWSMNHQSLLGLVKKVVQADKIIHEQILSIPWTPPAAYQALMACTNNNTAGTAPSNPIKNTNATGDSKGPLTKPLDALKAGTKPIPETDSRLRKVLEILSAEAAFLVDPKVLEAIADLPDNERLLHHCDSILKCLGVDDKEDLDEIVSLFFQGEGSGDDVDEPESPIVHPNDFVKVIRKYVANKRTKSESIGINSLGGNKDAEAAEAAGGIDKRDRKKHRDKEFWENIANVIDPAKLKVWKAVETSLVQYNTVLTERAEIVAETRQLAEQNAHLKQLLDQYLSAKINQELNIPPSHVLEFPKF